MLTPIPPSRLSAVSECVFLKKDAKTFETLATGQVGVGHILCILY